MSANLRLASSSTHEIMLREESNRREEAREQFAEWQRRKHRRETMLTALAMLAIGGLMTWGWMS